MKRSVLAAAFPLLLCACSEEVGKPATTGEPPGNENDATFEVPVPAEGRTYVSLAKPEIVVPEGDATASTAWDLAFEKLDVFTNSGASGSGEGGAFGPLDAVTFDDGIAPAVPFMTKDESGGAFRDFWAYDPSVHVLWVRYHVYGVRDGDKQWKVQVLGYYAEQQGAPVAAIYRVRWAEVTSAGVGPTQTLADIDGTAGGSQAPEDAPSECLDLGTGARTKHTPAEALTTKDWHLCFRRASVSVNGELGGPRGVTAVDLHAAETKDETLDIVKTRTDDSELPRFDAVGHAELSDPKLVWRGDRIFSALSDYWIDRAAATPAPTDATWLVQSAADGVSRYLLVFDRFDGATADGPGKVVLRVKPEGVPQQ
ncbi:HmuY family protein [Polyangium jinanense]|uniref:HmuY family protein n=1 Tax=Polyangium jinanense TaxID=2829994 RepID=A0A9X3WVY1_9BACT|nr:HmuY family protein [Polyangium jinanense]MDC3953695.1 HmuY family protein [Polyangium jinanense]MDC3979184.1 HmuY family protein [Polyangium jinanense]